MNLQTTNWLPFISVGLTFLVLFASIVAGYAVLRKRVKDNEDDMKEIKDDSSNFLTKDKHDDMCKIASLEMKKHVSTSIQNTFDNFREKVFIPEMEKLMKAIKGDGG